MTSKPIPPPPHYGETEDEWLDRMAGRERRPNRSVDRRPPGRKMWAQDWRDRYPGPKSGVKAGKVRGRLERAAQQREGSHDR